MEVLKAISETLAPEVDDVANQMSFKTRYEPRSDGKVREWTTTKPPSHAEMVEAWRENEIEKLRIVVRVEYRRRGIHEVQGHRAEQVRRR